MKKVILDGLLFFAYAKRSEKSALVASGLKVSLLESQHISCNDDFILWINIPGNFLLTCALLLFSHDSFIAELSTKMNPLPT